MGGIAGFPSHELPTRRAFLKTTGIAGATAAVALGARPVMRALAANELTPEPGREAYVCVCRPNCGAGCAFNVFVEDGKAVNLRRLAYPNADENGGCQRGHSHLQRMYDPNRLKYPMKRVGARGEGKWERISWEEAISTITTQWKQYQKEFGNESVAFSQGSGNLGADVTYMYKLESFMGASTIGESYDSVGMSSMVNQFGFGLYFIGNAWADLPRARRIFIWGANPTESAVTQYHWLARAKEQGAEVICIDPNFTAAAGKADEFVSIRPGSDGLLAIAMMNIILQEKLQDEETVKKYTVGPFLVKTDDGQFLRKSDLGLAQKGAKDDVILVMEESGVVADSATSANPMLYGTYEVQGIHVSTAMTLLVERLSEWSVEDAAQKCDIPTEKIYELARKYAEGPSTILTGYGPDHWVNGQTFYYNIGALAMLSGQLGKPGRGITGCSIGTATAMGPSAGGMTLVNGPSSGTFIPAMHLPAVLEKGEYRAMSKLTAYGPAFPEPVGESAETRPITIKSLYFYCHNALGNQAGRTALLKAMDKVDLIVVADSVMTDTTRYADIILPVPHFWETETYYTSGTRYVRISEAAVKPQFECKGDFEIATLLGIGMGFESEFKLTREEFLRGAFDNDTARGLGISYDKLKSDKFIFAGFPGIYLQGEGGTFYTPTGRAEFYRENVLQAGDASGRRWDAARERLPYWEPPHEAWFENEAAIKKYPLTFMSERDKFKVHTQFSHIPALLELSPEPYVKISPADAKARGIATGDVVKVFNDRGYVVIKAVVSAAYRPGVLVIDHGWQADQFIEGHYNDLSSNYTWDAIPSNGWFDCLVEVERHVTAKEH